MVVVLQEPSIYRFLSEEPPTLAQLERHYDYLSGGQSPDGKEAWLTWILMSEDSPAPLGFLQATVKEPERVHIAYVLSPSHWRRGYGREAVSALLDVVFERYRVERAIAEMDTRNKASIALVESLGFRYLETVHDAAELDGSASHEHVYELTPAAWAAGAALRER